MQNNKNHIPINQPPNPIQQPLNQQSIPQPHQQPLQQQPYYVQTQPPPNNGYYQNQPPAPNPPIQPQQSSNLNLHPPPFVNSYPNYPPQNYQYSQYPQQQQSQSINTSNQPSSSISSDSPNQHSHYSNQNHLSIHSINNNTQVPQPQPRLKSPVNNIAPPNNTSLTPQNQPPLKSQSPASIETTNQKNPKKRPHTSSQPLSRATVTYPRKRAVTACQVCRLKKTKCDNVRPQCGSCERSNVKCQYLTDQNQKDYSSYDPASLSILSKLDIILKDLKHIKGEENEELKSNDNKKQNAQKFEEFDKCIWDMSVTSIFDWHCFQKEIKEDEEYLQEIKSDLISNYDKNLRIGNNQSFIDQLKEFENLDKLINNNFSNIINSFFVNIYTKLPIIDVYEFFELLEFYQFLNNQIDDFTFVKFIEYFNDDFKISPIIEKVYEDNNLAINMGKIQELIHSIPLILLICALGISSTPVNLDNLNTFEDSLEESSSIDIGCLSNAESFKNIPPHFSKNRTEIAFKLKKYAEVIITLFPEVLPTNSMLSTQYYIMQHQLYIQNNYPLLAHESILTASKNIMYYLQKFPEKNYDIKGILFWTCLKLECESNTELSPLVPLSGINLFTPPINFPRIPEPPRKNLYNENIMKLANKYDDEYTWYFFLTEIAIRKIDNKMFDDFYSLSSKNLWDNEHFIKEEFFKKFIKYINQYNGVINSLTPEIRNFVLQEINVDQIYRRMKIRYEKKHNNKTKRGESVSDSEYNINQDQIFDSLDDFLIDDDLLLKAQSESIMYIKTRVIASKLMLFRPIIYLFLEDKISYLEIFEAIATILQHNLTSQIPILDSPNSTSSSTISTNQESDFQNLNFFNLRKAPLIYQKHYPDEDFSNLVEYNEGEEDIVIKDFTKTKQKILIIFIQNLISIPKLNIPKLSSHRHPGSWYFIRNMFIATIYQFLIYKKFIKIIEEINHTPIIQQNIVGKFFAGSKTWDEIKTLLNLIIDKTSVLAFLEHSLIVFQYWKLEMRDCEIYQVFVKKMINNL
ncbi:ZCF27 [Candida jiufengensis]|uniref:ZCF27 n=1 Tax=Candida jiufengensis TaxID=497108 RepID=UPI0022241F21|nr:ZCF27 [Candida jiufengensis]KAI5955124.1 ZCF27 [Candida jiufengensis]